MAGTTDTVPARLTPGEFVIKRESAKMLGKPFLEQLNAVSDNSAHSNIDALISQAALAQMQPMAGGGYVGNQNIAGYENGGDVLDEKNLGFLGRLLSKLSGADKRQKAYEELVPKADNVDMPLQALNYRLPFESELSGTSEDEIADEIALYFQNKEAEQLMRKIDFADTEGYNLYKYYKTDDEGRPATQGYQDGGAVSDNTATSAMDALIAQAKIAELQKKNPLSNYSMVDADKVDAENQEILNAIIDSVMPGGAIGSIKQTGKLAPLAKKFASLAPDKGKQKVLDKIASEMSVAPSRKVMQNPSRNLYDYKDYKVLENTLNKPFDAMDLINKGYLQKYTNKLVRNMNPSGSVKLGDIVDADYASNMRGGYYNINDMAKEVIKLPKKERIKAAKDLLKYFNINLRNVKGKQEGGEIADSLFGMSMDEFNKILASELLESSMTGENLPKRIELSPEEDKFRNNPNPEKPFGMTILDDLLLRAYEQYRFGRLPSMKD